jgi:hypothetical protein
MLMWLQLVLIVETGSSSTMLCLEYGQKVTKHCYYMSLEAEINGS